MTVPLRYGLADTFLTEPEVSPPAPFSAVASRILLSDEPSRHFAIIGGADLLGAAPGYSTGPVDTKAYVRFNIQQKPEETTFIVYKMIYATVSAHANVFGYGSGQLPPAAPTLSTILPGGVGIAEPRDPVSSFVEPLRRLTDQLLHKRPFEAPAKVSVLAELALLRLRERRDEDIDQWARRLIDGLPDADD